MRPTLKDRLQTIRSAFDAAAPAEAVEILSCATQALVDSGQVGRALGEGHAAPDFALQDTMGRTIRLGDVLRRGSLVLTFTHGHWCPYCKEELDALHHVSPEVRAAGATLLAVSPELPNFSGGLITSKGLGFEIVRDEGNQLAHAFGLRHQLPEAQREVYMHFGIDLPGANGEASWTLPLPARYVIDKTGEIVSARVHADDIHRPDPSDTLKALAALRA